MVRMRAFAPECGLLHTGFLRDFTYPELLSASLLSMLCFQSSTALMYKAFHLIEDSIWLFNFYVVIHKSHFKNKQGLQILIMRLNYSG